MEGVGVGRKEQALQRATLASGSALLHFLWQDRAWGRSFHTPGGGRLEATARA